MFPATALGANGSGRSHRRSVCTSGPALGDLPEATPRRSGPREDSRSWVLSHDPLPPAVRPLVPTGTSEVDYSTASAASSASSLASAASSVAYSASSTAAIAKSTASAA